MKEIISPLNERSSHGGFATVDLAVYHYYKHRFFAGIGELSPEAYFELAASVVSQNANRRGSILSQNGRCRMISFADDVRNVLVIVIDRLIENGKSSSLATIMQLKTERKKEKESSATALCTNSPF